LNLPAANFSVALNNPRTRAWQALFIQNSFFIGKRGLPTLAFAFPGKLTARTLSLCHLALGEHWQTTSGGTSSSHGPFFSRKAAFLRMLGMIYAA